MAAPAMGTVAPAPVSASAGPLAEAEGCGVAEPFPLPVGALLLPAAAAYQASGYHRVGDNTPWPEAASYQLLLKDLPLRTQEMHLRRRFFDQVAVGEKTIEIRVAYPHLADLAPGANPQQLVSHGVSHEGRATPLACDDARFGFGPQLPGQCSGVAPPQVSVGAGR